MDKKETTQKSDDITATLQRLIEQAQLKAGLLKLESREAWEDLSKGLEKIQHFLKKDWQQTKEDVDRAQLQAHLGMMEAREEWNEFRDLVQYMVDNTNAGEDIDRARVQMHLAKMDTEDRFKDKKKQWEQTYEKDVKPFLKKSMEQMELDMETMAKSMID
jgi:hypothetical protein